MIKVVLFQPEIPQNTANIMRTCAAVNAELHVIHPCGFEMNIEHPILKRSSANHLKKIKIYEYNNYKDFKDKNNNSKINIITKYGDKIYNEIENEEDIFIMFGKESSGVIDEILIDNKKTLYRLPMIEDMRSLNLSNAVAIVIYKILEKKNFNGLK